MPQISANKIRFDAQDWLAGVNQQYTNSLTSLPQMIGNGATVMKGIDPFRALGYLVPAPLGADATNVSGVSNPLLNIAYGSESSVDYGYLIEQGTKLHRLQISNFTLGAAGSWPHTISGTGTETGDDCISYSTNISSTRTPCIFYSWNDSGAAWDVGIFNVGAGTFDDDWMSTIPATPLSASGNAKRHPMIVGANDLLYIGDGNELHALDGATGANGTYYTKVLTLPSSYQISSFAKTGQFLVVFAYESFAGDILLTSPTASTRNATAFFYDYLSLDPTYVIPIDDDYVSCGLSFQSTVACFSGGAKMTRELGGADRYARLRVWDGAQFTIVKQFVGNPPLHGGATVANNAIQWLTSQGYVLSYGSPYEDIDAGLNQLYDAGGISLGVYDITAGPSGYPLGSSGSTTSGGLQQWKSNYESTALYVTGAATPLLDDGQVAQIESVTIYYGAEITAGRGLSVALITETGTSTALTASVEAITSSNKVTKISYDTSGAKLPRCQEVRLSFTYDAGSASNRAPAVRFVEIKYKAVNSNI